MLLKSLLNFETIITGIAALLYWSLAVSYCLKGNYPWTLVWFTYGLANIGLLWAATKS